MAVERGLFNDALQYICHGLQATIWHGAGAEGATLAALVFIALCGKFDDQWLNKSHDLLADRPTFRADSAMFGCTHFASPSGIACWGVAATQRKPVSVCL